MLLPAPVRPFFVLVCPRCSTASCFAVQRGYNGFSLPLLFYLLISFHCQLLSTMIGDRSAFLSSPLFRPFYPVSSVFHRRFLSGFSSHLVCHHPGLLFRFQHGRTHQFFGKPGGRIADLRVLIPYLLFDVFQTHTSLYHITVPYSVSFVSSAVLPAFPVPLPLPAPTDDWHNREHRTITLFPSPRLLMDILPRYTADRLHGAGKTPKTEPSEGNACKISGNAGTLLLKMCIRCILPFHGTPRTPKQER